MDRCLETIALRNDLTLGELSLLLSLSQMHTFCSRTELADFAGLSKSSLSRTLQKLSAKDYIRVSSTRKYLHVDLLPAATALLPELATAQNDFDAARFAGLTEEELICCAEYREDKRKYETGARRLKLRQESTFRCSNHSIHSPRQVHSCPVSSAFPPVQAAPRSCVRPSGGPAKAAWHGSLLSLSDVSE